MLNAEVIKRFKFYSQPVLPLVYDESLSYYEVLDKVVKYLNDLIDNQNEMVEFLKGINIDFETIKRDIELIKTELEKVKNGEYVSIYLDALIKWIDDNIQTLIARIVKYVFFVIDDDGYFNAIIPFAWDFIRFDTGFDTTKENEYLHLILEW